MTASVEVVIDGIDDVSVDKSISFNLFGSSQSILTGVDSVEGFEFIFGTSSNDSFEITDITADMTIFGGNGIDTLTLSSSLTGAVHNTFTCLLYTSPSPRDGLLSRMPSSA